MTNRRNIIIAISAIVVFAAMVGFFITLDVSPQIAYARLFIDAGLVIGLIAVVMAFYKEKQFSFETIIKTLAQLKNGEFKARIATDESNPLNSVYKEVNALASALEQQHKKQEEIKRNLREELLPGIHQKEPTRFEHSHHPELGPVRRIEHSQSSLITNSNQNNTQSDFSMPPAESDHHEPNRIHNTLIQSNPPKVQSAHESGNDAPTVNDQDIDELFKKFVDAQSNANLETIEYSTFQETVEATKRDLMSTYQCHTVLFDIIVDADRVALQPKIVRGQTE